MPFVASSTKSAALPAIRKLAACVIGTARAHAQAPAYLVKDINVLPVVLSSEPGPFVTVGGTTVFSAFTPSSGRELWTTDGTAAGTVLVKGHQSRRHGFLTFRL